MSDLQRDIERMERLVEAVGDEYDEAAVQRIRARITPDRERIEQALRDADAEYRSRGGYWAAMTDAAIAAMGEP